MHMMRSGNSRSVHLGDVQHGDGFVIFGGMIVGPINYQSAGEELYTIFGH